MSGLRATVTSKGQVTLPKAVRQALELGQADVVEFELQHGQAVLRPVRKGFLTRFGTVQPRARPEDWRKVREETAAGIAQEVAEEAG
ncbi:MAG TPA: AbrB/MazE/SpoVT family DNA-binding domain-containing protein [Dehalococcoidia bacterium]|nr:AbrB/MazE/SpoVT family DNA-binding domain-containing protein [Dehalococcoidia bacterium]